MVSKVFIDGAAGTTGLEIRERLAGRCEFSLVQLSDARAQGPQGARRARSTTPRSSSFACPTRRRATPWRMIDNPRVRVIDASTAHRVAPGWIYGFPELEPDQREKIAASKRVSNPGCWPTGFLALVRPLVRAGLVPPDFPLTVTGVSGYSGGGKAMIEEFEAKDTPGYVETVVRTYGLTLAHKHTPEMRVHAGLAHAPVFSPNVGRFYRGMIVEVPLQLWALPRRPTVYDLFEVLGDAYRGEKLIEVADLDHIDFFKAMRQGTPYAIASRAPQSIDAEMLKLTNGMKLFVLGNDKTEQARLLAVLDNLGKGASGAAVQNLNIMCGLPETAGLV